MFRTEDSELMQTDAVKPIEYLGGVMDEETRPLLKSYIQGLKEGEGALVVFRLGEGDSPDMLLESDITQIAGHGWNYVSGGTGNSDMQQLVNNLSAEATHLRVANKLFSQGGAKIKAYDEHSICFGLIGNGTGEITSIKGIVHQQLNMGLNGDLLLHEGDIIMQSLIKNGVFNLGDRQRPIHVQTYGAGGSASEVMNPGKMAVSDGVIDIRTHVDSLSTIEYLEKYVSGVDKGFGKLEDFHAQAQKIRDMIEQEPNYSGIASVHDMAELARLASAYSGETTVAMMDGMDSNDKRYCGEITFGTPYYGTAVAYRITQDATGQPFLGDDGQKRLVKELQKSISEMGKVNRGEQQKAIDNLVTKMNDIKDSRTNNTAALLDFLLKSLEPEELEYINKSMEKVTVLIEENRRLMQQLLDNPDNFTVNSELENKIEANSRLISRMVNGQIAIMNGAVAELASAYQTAYEPLKANMLSQESARLKSERDLLTIFHEQTRLSKLGFDRDVTLNAIEDKRQQMAALAERNFTVEQRLDYWIASAEVKYLLRDNDTAIDLLDKTEHSDTEVVDQLQERIHINDSLITGYMIQLEDLLRSASANLVGEDKVTYDTLNKEVESLNQILEQQNRDLSLAAGQHAALVGADRKLRFYIDKSRSIHDSLYSGNDFSITACGNIFFTEDDKAAVGKYGAQLVEMENSLFIEIIHHSIANQLYISREHITKIAADPLKIEDHVSSRLNEWASTYTMTVDDYVDAFMWANNGQSFSDFPESGRWTVAEELYNTDDIAKTRFYNFGQDEVKIVNPFWKEIGTDLVKEIKDGKAFQGKAYAKMNFGTDPLKAEKKRLQDLASDIISNPADPEERVRQLFTAYLTLMKPMQVKDQLELEPHEQRYRSYARFIPVLQTGYVGGAISDWDQPIYKSSNTALLDNKASDFLALRGGKTAGGGVALTVHSKVGESIDSGNIVLFKMMKAERADNHEEVIALGKQYLEAYNEPIVPVNATSIEVADLENTIAVIRADKAKIEDFMMKSVAKISKSETAEIIPIVQEVKKSRPAYPSALAGYIRREKITGPRVAEALAEMSKAEGPEAALETAEKFLAWKVSANRHFNVQPIKAMLPGLRKEIQASQPVSKDDSASSMKERLRGIKGETGEENLSSDFGSTVPK